jgi:N-methylhydantoinase A
MDAVWRELAEEADRDLEREGVPAARRRLVRLADLRYAKQGFELTLEAPAAMLDPAAAARLIEGFHSTHERLYTFAERATPVEVVTLRLRAIGLVDKIALPEVAAAQGTAPPVHERRTVRLDDAVHERTVVYRRDALLAGHTIRGPAIVDQLDATTLVFPGQTAEVDRHGNLILSLA